MPVLVVLPMSASSRGVVLRWTTYEIVGASMWDSGLQNDKRPSFLKVRSHVGVYNRATRLGVSIGSFDEIPVFSAMREAQNSRCRYEAGSRGLQMLDGSTRPEVVHVKYQCLHMLKVEPVSMRSRRGRGHAQSGSTHV